MGDWRRPYEVNWLRQLGPVLPVLVVLFLCFAGAPFGFGIRPDWWQVFLNPVVDLFLLYVLVLGWVAARTGVYVGDAGVMVRVWFHRVVVPWQEIAYAQIADVSMSPVIWQRGPSLGLVLVSSDGEVRPLPARVAAFTVRWGRGRPPYVSLTHERMAQVVKHVNELAAGRPDNTPSKGSGFR